MVLVMLAILVGGAEAINSDIRILACPLKADGDSWTGKSGTRHPLNNTKNKAIPCPWEKLVMIALNAALLTWCPSQ